MILLQLAMKSLRNRLLTTVLTVISIALSVILLLSVERMRRAAEEGFTQTISQTDLIVGARTGPLNLILYTVFNIGSATNNISVQSWEHFRQHPAVEWTIPYSLGDGHRGYRVVATNEDFFSHYHYRGDGTVQFAKGATLQGLWDVVIGADVAADLHYDLGQSVVLAHGVTHGEGILKHDDKPFHVTGILQRTGTPLDRALYITLEGMEAIHMDWQSGAPPRPGAEVKPESLKKENIHVDQITAFFVRTKSRIETLRLQREINTYTEEPLLAIIPGVTLAELWHGMSYAERILKIVSIMVMVVGLLAMLIALTTSLNERRHEMSILRALGAGGVKIAALLILESTCLTVLGIMLGLIFSVSATALLQPWIEREFGLYLVGPTFGTTEGIYLVGIFLAGLLVGVIPAWRATSQALKDGLTVKT
jgi:putative ABC transport system permease protein